MDIKSRAFRVYAFVSALLAGFFVTMGRALASAPVVDPDLSDAVDTMAATVKVNALYAAVAIIVVSTVIWLLFWAFGKLKKTAGR